MGKEMGKCSEVDSDVIRLSFRMIIWLPCTERNREGTVGRQNANRRFTQVQRGLIRNLSSRS